MNTFAFILLAMLLYPADRNTHFDFGANRDGNNWRTLNDGVMGGLSEGRMEFTKDALKFYGAISLRNNGGFASVRSPFASYDLSGVRKVKLRYRNEGQVIALNLENFAEYYRPYFKLFLPDTKGEWMTVEIDVAEFKQYVLGRETGVSIDDDFLRNVIRVGFVANNKTEGSFSAEIDYLLFE